MATKILLKKSTTAGNIPATNEVEAGELAVNLVDRKIYTKDGSGAVIRLDAAYVDSTAPSNPVEGDIWFDTANNILKAYNGTSFVSAGYQTLAALEDTNFTSLTSGDYVKYSGSEFVNASLETDVEALLSAANTGTGYGDLSYSSGVFSFDRVTDADIRGAVSVTDAGGDGSLSYNSATGVITYTGPSAAETRAHISVTDSGGDGSMSYDSATGVITYVGPSAAEVQAHITAGTGVTIAAGQVSIGQPVGTADDVTFAKVTSSDVETDTISHAGGTITLDPTNDGANTGVVVIAGDLTVNGTTTTVNSNTVEIGDSIIVLNSDETGTPSQDAGIEVERGTAANKVFKWNETDDAWDLGDETLQNVTLDGGTF